MDVKSSERLIMSFLKDAQRVDLVKEFKIILAKSRSRQESRIKIEHLSFTIFKHLILLILFERHKISVPSSWSHEIQAYLDEINAINFKRKGKWFTAKEIFKILNDDLNISIKKVVLNKLQSFSKAIQEKITNDLDVFFENPDLRKLNVELRY